MKIIKKWNNFGELVYIDKQMTEQEYITYNKIETLNETMTWIIIGIVLVIIIKFIMYIVIK